MATISKSRLLSQSTADDGLLSVLPRDAFDNNVVPVGQLIIEEETGRLYSGDGATQGGRYQAHIVRNYVHELPGVVSGAVSPAQRAINRAAINLALAGGLVLRLRAGDYFEIDQSLLMVSRSGIICEEDGTRPIIFMPAAHFTTADNTFANRYLPGSVGIGAYGQLDGVFAPLSDIKLGGFAVQSEVADNRNVRALAFRNVVGLELDDIEVFGLPLGEAFSFHSVRGSGRRLNAHDCYTNTTLNALVTNAPNTTGFLFDSDRVNLIGSDFYLYSPKVADIKCGPAFRGANGGDQSDGINVAGRNSSIRVEAADIRRCAEAFDLFGTHCDIRGAYIEDAYNFGLKYVHGASHCRASNITIVRAGLAGVVFSTASDDTAEVHDIAINNLIVDGVNAHGRWTANGNAAVLFQQNAAGQTSYQTHDVTITGAVLNLGALGKYGWLDSSSGVDNVGKDIDFVSGPSAAAAIWIQNGAGWVQPRTTAAKLGSDGIAVPFQAGWPTEKIRTVTEATTILDKLDQRVAVVTNQATNVYLAPGCRVTIEDRSNTAHINPITVNNARGGTFTASVPGFVGMGYIVGNLLIVSNTTSGALEIGMLVYPNGGQPARVVGLVTALIALLDNEQTIGTSSAPIALTTRSQILRVSALGTITTIFAGYVVSGAGLTTTGLLRQTRGIRGQIGDYEMVAYQPTLAALAVTAATDGNIAGRSAGGSSMTYKIASKGGRATFKGNPTNGIAVSDIVPATTEVVQQIQVNATQIDPVTTYARVNNTSGAAFSIVLPTAPFDGQVVTVKDHQGNAAAFPITVSAESGVPLDTSSGTFTINTNYGSRRFTYAGSKWNS